MHIVMMSLVVALIVCVLMLGVFGLFTVTPAAKRIEKRDQPKKRPLG
jgi:hypothetical protein